MLSGNQKRYLRALAHHRKPVLTVGAQGVSQALLLEADQALAHHELLKVKLPAGSASERRAILERICAASGAHCVQTIGRVGVIYRAAAEPVITLPEA